MNDFMNDIWEKMGDWFYADERQGYPCFIEIRSLTDQEIIDVYSWVVSISGIYTDDHPLTWSLTEERDIPIMGLDNPARSYIEGEILHVKHWFDDIIIDGVKIPYLGVQLFDYNPGTIAFNYEVGPDWGPGQLGALFTFLKDLIQIAPGAQVVNTGPTDIENEIFEDLFNEYLKATM